MQKSQRKTQEIAEAPHLNLTPADNLPVPADIKPEVLQGKRATIALASWAKEPNHLLHDNLHSRFIKQQKYLKSICVSCA